MIGTDTWVNSQWDDYEELIALNRSWLARLPRDVAERIAYRNAARLFGRDVSSKLIGTR
jgi:predicted TIM-barrel fold metal-dependent hydrolase